MPKLKALRGSIGSYGRVAAGGIIEVDDNVAEKLVKTKNFVKATTADIAAAQEAQAAFLKTDVPGATAGFAPVPTGTTPIEDEFSALEIDQQRAVLEKASAEMQAEAKRLHDLGDDLHKRGVELADLEAALALKADELETMAAAQKAEGERLDAAAEAIGKRETAVADAEKAAAAKTASDKKKASET